jgi:hypothetical protein
MRTLIKITCCVFAVVFLMASCLGDTEQAIEKTNDFAYFKIENGVKYAVTGLGYPIYAQDMSEFENGECYLISYKLNGTTDTNGIYFAETLYRNEGPFNKSSLSTGTPYSGISLDQQSDSIQITSFEPQYGSPSKSMYGDNWLFKVTASVKSGDNLKAYFYYNPEDQIDENRADEVGVEAKKLIVDVRFIKEAGNGEGTASNKTFYILGNLGSLRYLSIPVGTEGYTNIPIKFRYTTPVSNSTPKLAYKGSWNTGGSTIVYVMQYTN